MGVKGTEPPDLDLLDRGSGSPPVVVDVSRYPRVSILFGKQTIPLDLRGIRNGIIRAAIMDVAFPSDGKEEMFVHPHTLQARLMDFPDETPGVLKIREALEPFVTPKKRRAA